jgi:hypothetical protein
MRIGVWLLRDNSLVNRHGLTRVVTFIAGAELLIGV